MKLFDHLKTFAADESGAVTVDWVVLTASVVFLALAIIALISPATEDLGQRISDELNNVQTGPGSSGGTP
jgi:Flp pilus assembly pilin Flp